MVNKIKNFLAWHLPVTGKLSQAYEGEDIMLWRLFTEEIPTKNGFYIDVGAFHPRQYSNTWLLRKKLGFHGMNIEPSDRGIKQFERRRKKDINLKVLCSYKVGLLNFQENKTDPALSKICIPKNDAEVNFEWGYDLGSICGVYKVFNIDLLSIDVEGYELAVLEGHDWRISPKVIICELNDDVTETYILQKGYKLYGRTKRNGIYIQS